MLSVQCEVERVGSVTHQGQQLVQCPPLHHSFQWVLPAANNRANPPNQFTESVGVAGVWVFCSSRLQQSKVHWPQQCDKRLPASCSTGWKIPASSGNSQHLLVQSLSVGLPVQPVVDANMQVFTVPARTHSSCVCSNILKHLNLS